MRKSKFTKGHVSTPEVTILSTTSRGDSPPEVTTFVPLGVEPSSNYSAPKSIATPRDRGDVSPKEQTSNAVDVTSSGIPGSDLWEFEGEVIGGGDGRTTSGGTPSGNTSNRVLSASGKDIVVSQVECCLPDEVNVGINGHMLLSGERDMDKSGIIYISRLPPYMGVSKLRSYFSGFGRIGKIYAHPESENDYKKRIKLGGNKKLKFTHAWIQFEDKGIAKSVSKLLNNKPIGDKRKHAFWSQDLWNITYLPKFKWHHLIEYWSKHKRERKEKLSVLIASDKKVNNHYLNQLDIEKKNKFKSMKKNKHKSYNNNLTEPPEVITTVGLADSSSTYLSLKSIATPGDRGGSEGVVDVTSSELHAADLREAEGEVIRRAVCKTRKGVQVEANEEASVENIVGDDSSGEDIPMNLIDAIIM